MQRDPISPLYLTFGRREHDLASCGSQLAHGQHGSKAPVWLMDDECSTSRHLAAHVLRHLVAEEERQILGVDSPAKLYIHGPLPGD